MAPIASCDALAQLPCVFIVALGRTGSTHLQRLLNEIPGYRITGETDNAWIYLGWWHELLKRTPLQLQSRRLEEQRTEAQASLPASTSSKAKKKKKKHQKAQPPKLASSSPSSSSGGIAPVEQLQAQLCAMRELMLLVHNPLPRAVTFGFKEIYSPFVRQPSMFGEVFSQGVGLLRELFPRAKFIFHLRRNLTRTADSDFWSRDGTLLDWRARKAHFEHVGRSFADYVARHPDHAFATTLEGVTDRENRTELEGLFRFLGVPLTSKLRRIARAPSTLKDWVEQRHTRRIERRSADGKLLGVERRSYAYATGHRGR